MQWPTRLSRKTKNVHKYDFGHVLLLAGSRRFLGASALAGLASMRTGAGLTTIGIPSSLNAALHKKISSTIMTLPLAETSQQTLAVKAFTQLRTIISKIDVIAIGPGLSTHQSTAKLIKKIITHVDVPLVLDADALNILSSNVKILAKRKNETILTPHVGEMARLLKKKKETIGNESRETALNFAKKHKCTLLLKGPRSIVASLSGDIYVNKTGNSGMASAGSGDVLTGMIAALMAQGLSGFEAAKWGAYLHGLAGDIAAKDKTRTSLIATDIIDCIPLAIKRCKK